MYPITLQNSNFAKTYPNLNNIELADWNTDNKSLAIDILVGANFYWDIVLEGFMKGKSGPVALDTKVGYFFSGPTENSHQDECNSVMLTHVMKVQAEMIHSYYRSKDDFYKVLITKDLLMKESNLKRHKNGTKTI